ncbi:histone H3-like centromeric protein A isoform X2 [Macrotis lagotis]|uniref:histone H3-like centromeric protein A isoform X2 n=1 Tax=Macrotis lagotis TaxID=92651 RepID=UPI003D6868A4
MPTPGPRQADPSRTMRPGRRKNTPKKRPEPQAEPRASTSAAGPSRRHFPRRRNQHILREIRKLQKSTDLLIRRAPFGRLVREICLRYTRGVDFCWQAQALLALQEDVFPDVPLIKTERTQKAREQLAVESFHPRQELKY